MDKKIIVGLVGLVVVGVGSFYAGTKYSSSGNSMQARGFDANRLMGEGGMPRGGTTMMRSGQAMGSFTTGEVISKDTNGITVKISNGGSKIVLISDATAVSKSVSGSIADITVNESVMITGSTNSDGSINAQSIQLGVGRFGSTTAPRFEQQ